MTTTLTARWVHPDGSPLIIPGVTAAPTTTLDELDGLVSGGGWPLHPPGAWFDKPAWLKPAQKITIVTDGPEAGRVAGYVAPWGQCLLGGGAPGECFTAPSSPTDYVAAQQGEALTAEGALVHIANIGGGINHAPVHPGDFSQRVVDHYANVASQLMRVRYGEDEYGIYVAGVLWPEVTDRQIATIRASALSGDWRWRPELAAYDLAGSQLVNVPGFPLIRGVRAACEAHPILIGGMGGVPPGMLEEVIMEEEFATRSGAVGKRFAAPPALVACSCGSATGAVEQIAQLEAQLATLRIQLGAPAATAAPPGAVPTVPPTTPTPVQDTPPAPANDALDSEFDQRLADCEASIAELAGGLGELQAWMADQAASSLEGEQMPEAMMVSATAAFGDSKAPPFTKADGPGPGAPPKAQGPHAFVDANGDGKCDVCGKTEAAHAAMPAPAPAPAGK